MNIKLIADSTCDLPGELLQKHNIRLVPLSIVLDNQILKDGVEIAPNEIFDYVESGKGMCRTSAVNVAEYMAVYQEELPTCDAIIHFTISSEMSSCYQNACLAAEEFDNIYIVDSRNLSNAIGLLVLEVAELAIKNINAKEIHHKITQHIALLDASFLLDTLSYLHKGGRCTAIQAIASSVLKIKPSIIVVDGKMTVGKKYRGKLESVLRQYVEDKLSDKENIDTHRIFVAHTMTESNRLVVDMVKSLIYDILPFKEIYETTAGGTISCHCGPNTLGLFFLRKE